MQKTILRVVVLSLIISSLALCFLIGYYYGRHDFNKNFVNQLKNETLKEAALRLQSLPGLNTETNSNIIEGSILEISESKIEIMSTARTIEDALWQTNKRITVMVKPQTKIYYTTINETLLAEPNKLSSPFVDHSLTIKDLTISESIIVQIDPNEKFSPIVTALAIKTNVRK